MIKNNLPLSFMELSKKNLMHNIKQFRSFISKGTKISIAVKGNAYGHGQNIVAEILEPYVDYFQVNSVEEFELLRKVSRKNILVLGYVGNSDLLKVMKPGTILTFFSISQLRVINKIAKKLNTMQEVHVPIDAHLGREGFLLKELANVLKTKMKLKHINLTGIYAHFANIEDAVNPVHSRKQIQEYKQALEIAKSYGFDKLQTHISATSGTLVYEKRSGLHSIVRLGIGVYGLWPSKHLETLYKKSKFTLKPVMAWKTKIAQIKTLPKGFPIGYGLTYVTKKKMKIAVIPQGYADGFDRGFSNVGQVLINSTRCKVLGRISMNMFVVNVSHLLKVKEGDEVVLLGRQGNEKITAEEMAARIDTINYEITTRISSLLPRIVV
jgi:alanine racemase